MALKTVSSGFVREWMQSVGLKQSDLVKKLEWPKAKANAIWHNRQRLNEDLLDEIAPLVNAKNYELLMPPEEAFRIRRLHAALAELVAPPAPSNATPADAPAAKHKVG